MDFATDAHLGLSATIIRLKISVSSKCSPQVGGCKIGVVVNAFISFTNANSHSLEKRMTHSWLGVRTRAQQSYSSP